MKEIIYAISAYEFDQSEVTLIGVTKAIWPTVCYHHHDIGP